MHAVCQGWVVPFFSCDGIEFVLNVGSIVENVPENRITHPCRVYLKTNVASFL